MKFHFTLLIGFILLSACRNDSSSNTITKKESIDVVFTDFYEFKKNSNPIEATKAGYMSYNDTIANYISEAYQSHMIRSYDAFLERLAQFDSTELTTSEWMSVRVMQWDCTIKKEGFTNDLVTMASPIYDLPSFELMPLLQIQSLHLYVAQLAGGTSVQPFETIEDYDDWLARINDYIAFLDTSMDQMEEGIRQKVVLPKSLVQKMIPQLQAFMTAPLEEHLFYSPIKQLSADFPLVEQERLKGAYQKIISEKLIPAYSKLNAFLKNTYLPLCRETAGIGDLPHGKETYDYLVKLHTTTNNTPEEIHQLGLQEVARIAEEMKKAKNTIGFSGDLKAFFEHVRSSPEQMPFSDPNEVIAYFNEIRSRIEDRFPTVFNVSPKANFKVRRTEAFREASASAEYVPGSKDALRSGIFYVPIPDARKYNKFTAEALFLHEAIPGHHYQLSLQQENNQLPEFLHPESMGVFVEGWALYAESLGKELGLYQDPYQYFGMLSMEMHRAIRLVVDTGIHAKGWSRARAIQYSLDNEAASEEEIIAEIERYMATPGQALSYKMGQLKIQELRIKAEKAFGDAFDIREFHDQVLNSGSLPLVLLEEKINRWIASEMNIKKPK